MKLEYASTADTLTNRCTSRKLLNPVYVPIGELNYLLSLSPSQIEHRVVKSLKLAPGDKQFMYVPLDIPQSSS